MANQVLVGAGGDVIGPLTLPAQNTTIIAQIKFLGATVGLNLALQARVSTNGAWITIKMKDPNADAMISALTTDGQIGWAENTGYSDFRLLQTGAVTGAAADVYLNIGDDE